MLRASLVAGLLLAIGCGGVARSKGAKDRDGGGMLERHADAGEFIRDADAGPPPAGDYEPCGEAIACKEGTSARTFGATCVCAAHCTMAFGPDTCPAPPGLAAPYCTGDHFCEMPCAKYGDTAGCPEGLACGVTSQGLRCVTTPEIVAELARPDPRSTIRDFELYGACKTFETPECPRLPTGTGEAFLRSAECFCSALCFEDEDCPVPPSGYGRAVCLRETAPTDSVGYCALTCADSTGTFPCPAGLTCTAPPPTTCDESFFYEPPKGVSVCRGGYYQHGNGNDVIEPGEAYAVQRPRPPGCDPRTSVCAGVCDPNLRVSSDGTCPTSDCCSDTDCPAPPPGYPPPVCAWDGCHLSCTSDSDCPAGGFTCQRLDNAPFASDQRGCKK